MTKSPSGLVAFLFTDIEGSTQLAQQNPRAWESMEARHHAILQTAMDVFHGDVFNIVGDAFCVAFADPLSAVQAAMDVQIKLAQEEWGEAKIKVRMGIHVGPAEKRGSDYHGYLTLALIQRVMSAGHGGQVLLTNAAQQLVYDQLPNGVAARSLGEHKLKDLKLPEHLYQLIIPNLPADFPPLKTLNHYRHNLPTQLTSFIGREREISEVIQLIRDSRIVTLTGSGGAGKTRLSLQAGAECIEQFKNGVWFVELAPLTESSRIVGAVMSVLGLHEKDNDIHALARYIESQSMLLIFDNCEHLIEDCARLVEGLIQSCPNLRVISSSREAFGIVGEHPYRVPSLPFPDPKRLPLLDEIERCESVQLFIERVKIFSPSFALTEKNASFVADICFRLDGIPLALELAAARIKVMSVEQMASRLGDIFNLLTNGSRTALPRQQTLRALIEWSYDLLSESEKGLFRKLAAFSGGWSLDAAESICGAERSGASVLDDLARLVDKSLVVKEEHEGESRFHMLETIRQYAEFKMFASEEVEDVKNRHRDWYMKLAETAEPKLRTGEQLRWLNQLEMEHDNLRAAMNWSIAQKHVEQALRIPSALVYFWEIHGHEEEGRSWFKQALGLDVNTKKNRPLLWAKALHGHFQVSWAQADYLQFQPAMEDALNIFKAHGDEFSIAHTLYHLAVFPHSAGNMEDAAAKYRESFDVYNKINDNWGMGSCLHCIAHTAESEGNAAEAQKLFEESLSMLKTAGDRWTLYHPVGDSARIDANQGNLDKAELVFEESLAIFEELGSAGWKSATLRQLARVKYLKGEFAQAIELTERSLSIARLANDHGEQGWAYFRISAIQWAQAKYQDALQSILEALREIEKTGDKINISYVICFADFLKCHNGQISQGREKLEAALETIRVESPEDLPEMLMLFGRALWLEKDLSRAQAIIQESIAGLKRYHFFIKIPECIELLAAIAVAQNNPERGACLFGAAESMRERMHTPMPPVALEECGSYAAAVRVSFEDSWNKGRAMTMEQAIEYALEISA